MIMTESILKFYSFFAVSTASRLEIILMLIIKINSQSLAELKHI